MELVQSQKKIRNWGKSFTSGFILGDATMVMAVFETDPKVVKKVLPPPLQPASTPMGMAYVAEFHRTNFGVTYNEAALFLAAQYEGVLGRYCLSMPVTNDMAMIAGREVFGYPKKIAETIVVKRKGNKVTGTCVRRGFPILQIEAKLTGPFPGPMPPPEPHYLYKGFISPTFSGFDYNPRLLKQYNDIDWGEIEIGEGKVTLGKSKYDFLYEIPIKQVVMAAYTKGMEIRMKAGEVVAEVDAETYLPYTFNKYDWEI